MKGIAPVERHVSYFAKSKSKMSSHLSGDDKIGRIFRLLAVATGVAVTPLLAHAQQATASMDPPPFWFAGVQPTELFTSRMTGPNGSEMVMFEEYNGDCRIVFNTPHQGMLNENGCHKARTAFAATRDIRVFVVAVVGDDVALIAGDRGPLAATQYADSHRIAGRLSRRTGRPIMPQKNDHVG